MIGPGALKGSGCVRGGQWSSVGSSRPLEIIRSAVCRANNGLFSVNTSFNGGINQALDRLRAGKSINIVGILSACFRSVILNRLIKLMFYWITF